VAIDSNTAIWPTTLPVPLRAHQAIGEFNFARTQFESGRIRKRRLVEDPREGLDVVWNFTEDEFEAFKTFFDESLENGSLTFLITLFGREREVDFRDSTYGFNHSDNLYTVIAKLLIAPLIGNPTDDFELYLDGANLGGRDGGDNWAPNPWVSRANQFGIQCFDTFEYYSDGDRINGLNGGVHFTAAYVERANFIGIQVYDTMEEYIDGAGLQGLSAGTRWFAYPYVDRFNLSGIQSQDDMESYTNGANVNGLAGGTGWFGQPYVDR
jgi:hypothetical protein